MPQGHKVTVSPVAHGLSRVEVLTMYGDPKEFGSYTEKWGMMGKSGKLIADTIYNYVSDVTGDGVFVLVWNNKLGLMDTLGNMILPFAYKTDLLLWPNPSFNDGLLPVLSGDHLPSRFGIWGLNEYKVGFIDQKGKLVIDTMYHLANAVGDRHEELKEAIFNSNGGFCGTGMSIASEYVSRHPYYLKSGFYKFDGNRCLVELNGQPIIIDENGNRKGAITKPYNKIDNLGGNFRVDHSVKYSRYVVTYPGSDTVITEEYYDREGKIIHPPAKTEIATIWKDLLLVKTSGREEYRIVNPATGAFITNKKFKFFMVKDDGSLYTDLAIYKEPEDLFK